MHRIIFISHSRSRLPDGALDALSRAAAERNRAEGITGLLLYKAGVFFQIIEGPEERAEALADRIFSDRRHYKMKVLRRQPACRRRFPGWHMGFRRLTEAPDAPDAWFDLTRQSLAERIPETCAEGLRRLMRGYLEAHLPHRPITPALLPLASLPTLPAPDPLPARALAARPLVLGQPGLPRLPF